MSLSPGARLGPYEIVSAIGAGGMGEVFRVRDTKLNRDVAIKVLPAALAQDAERVGRFRREAQILATLNHPNIAAIYGLEETAAAGPGQSAVVGLVMELVAGEDLAERLRRGAIPVEEAIGIARQIAEALEEAHEHGIVHRDLKPANVRLTPDGKVKVLDFGLAKALEGDPSSSPTSPQISHSPTMSRHATEAGVILGTAAYMSPEQARGKTVDKRTDIWAFGVVLYEMLTGQRLFAGETVSDTLAAVLRADPDWKALPEETPAAINRLLHRCLTRDPKARLHDIADARLEIADAMGSAGREAKATAASSAGAVIPRWRHTLPWVAGGVMGAGLAVVVMRLGLGATLFGPAATNLATVTSTLLLPPGVKVSAYISPARSGGVAVSGDGRQIAFVGLTEDRRQIFVRAVDSQVARPVAGTEGGAFPAWSPDGRRIAFVQSNKLKQVSLDGGVAQVIADMTGNRSPAAWGLDGTLLFHNDYRGPLSRVSSGGGPVSEVLPAVGDDVSWFSPVWLPDGRRFLVVRFAYSDDNVKDAGIYAGSIGSKGLDLVVPGRIAEVALSNDEIFYRKGAELTAQPFDSRSLTLSGNPRVISNHASMIAAGGPTMVYFDPPGGLSLGYRIAWLSRSGALLSTTGAAGSFRDPRISPDGRSLAIARADENGLFAIWKYDIARNIDSRISGTTFSTPVWSRDGRSIIVSGPRGVLRFDAFAFGPPQVVRALKSRPSLLDLSPDGREALVSWFFPKSQLATMPLDGSADPRPISDQVVEGLTHAAVSPDGKWIAVDADEGTSRRLEVRPYPGPGSRIPVTAIGASYARWRGDGRELYFLSQVDGQRAIMVAAVTWSGGVPDFGPAQTLFKVPKLMPANFGFDVTPDGQRFVGVVADDPDPSPLTMVVRAAVR